KSYNLAESDRIIVFFTRSYGIVRGVAKGARRMKSRFGSTLEPFSKVRLVFFQKEDKELVTIRDAELIDSRFAVASDPARLAIFSHFGEMLTAFSAPHDADETLFRMLDACLSAGQEMGGLSALEVYFDFWLLRLSGFLPDWSRCSRCGKSRTEIGTAAIVFGFEFRCADCGFSPGAVIEKFGPADLRVLHTVERLSPVDFIQATRSACESLPKVRNLTTRLITNIIGGGRDGMVKSISSNISLDNAG
ncbi:MAG: DNA repair protein RecO, partial [Blastocatellia bacterium]